MINNSFFIRFTVIINLFIFHLCFLLVSFVFFCIFIDVKNALSWLFGGFISLFASFLFSLIYFFNSSTFSKNIVRKFYVAGFVKFISFIFLCVLAFLIGVTNIFLFFISLFLFQTTIWASFIFYFK